MSDRRRRKETRNPVPATTYHHHHNDAEFIDIDIHIPGSPYPEDIVNSNYPDDADDIKDERVQPVDAQTASIGRTDVATTISAEPPRRIRRKLNQQIKLLQEYMLEAGAYALAHERELESLEYKIDWISIPATVSAGATTILLGTEFIKQNTALQWITFGFSMISMATNGIINQWNKGNKLKGHTQKVIQYKELYRDLQYYLTESHRVEEIAHQAEHVLFTLNTLEKTQPNIPTKLLHACREDTKKQIEEQSTLYVLGVQVSETPTPPPQEKNEEQV